MFTVYCEKEIFENIVVFNDATPNWYNIFCNHSEVCLNMTDEELASEEIQGTPIFEFIKSNGGRKPIALKDYFDLVYTDTNIIIQKPRSAFFLNFSRNEAAELQHSLGIIVQSNEAIDDDILKGTYYKELPKDSLIESDSKVGWNQLLNYPLPPSNSIVIADEYLFKNEETEEIVGKHNVIQLLDSLLPPNLGIDFHVLIITQDHGRSKAWCERFTGELKASFVKLRSYQIKFEIVFAESVHKRKTFLNYMSLTCDKGFAIFRVSDSKTVRDSNDFRCERLFNRLNISEGDTDFTSSEIILNQIKRRCDTVKEYINNRGTETNYRILGDCKADKSLYNRLLNDV